MSNFRRRLIMALNKKENFDEFQEVEYLESTGTQYIDTTFNPTRDCKIEMDCKINTYNASLFGAYNNTNQRFQMFLGTLNTTTKTAWLGYRAFTTANSQAHYDNSLMFKAGDRLNIIFDVKNSIFTANNISMDIIDNNGPAINYPIWLSGGNQAGTIVTPSSMVIYSYKFYRDGVLLQDLIPCYRKSNGEIGMYDLVNNVFYTNKGSGTFTKGPDVVTNYFNYEDFYNNYVTVTQSNVGRYAIKLESNTSYIVSTNLKYGSSAKVFAVSGSNTNWAPSTINNGVLPDKPRTITTDSEGYMCIGIYVSGANIVNKSEFEDGTAWVKIKKVEN